jgi:hypothetical protein
MSARLPDSAALSNSSPAVEQARAAYHYDLQAPAPDLPDNLWDPKLRGLLAGEPLKLALTQLEAAYLREQRQELELTRHFSLRQINPFALAALRETGECSFTLPEALFDIDNPGHYFRRIHSVALSLPCIVGPYASVSATLRQDASRFREVADTSPTAASYPQNGAADERFKPIRPPAEQVIVISSGREDSVLFERFGEETYRPFEGTGAIFVLDAVTAEGFPAIRLPHPIGRHHSSALHRSAWW